MQGGALEGVGAGGALEGVGAGGTGWGGCRGDVPPPAPTPSSAPCHRKCGVKIVRQVFDTKQIKKIIFQIWNLLAEQYATVTCFGIHK